MRLPAAAALCIRTLEQAGFRAYAVGGCVRDALLGLTPHDYDLCTNALPQETAVLFAGYRLVRSGEKHGTIGVVMDGEVYEITTFRTEGGYADSRHPDWVKFVPSVEEDLARRDFTVNAMAYSPGEGYIDPWGGQADLRDHILRAVGDPATRFSEDPLRILRGVRFAVRYGLTPEPETRQAMEDLAPLMDKLARERVFDELCKLLPLVTAEDLIWAAPIITQVIPELKAAVGFDQHNPHHLYDIYRHTALVVEGVPGILPLRWAALLHDVGKASVYTQDEAGVGHFLGHAQAGADMADTILRRLKAPNALREQVVTLIQRHMVLIQPERRQVRRWMGRLRPEVLDWLLTLQEADIKGTGLPGDIQRLHAIREQMQILLQEQACLTVRDLAIDGHDLMALGFSGKAIGQCLNTLLEQVLEETIPNEKDTLLEAAKEIGGNT